MKRVITTLSLVALLGAVAALWKPDAPPNFACEALKKWRDTTELLLSSRVDSRARWIEVGQEFSGYRFDGYEASTGVVTFTKDGRLFPIKLADSVAANERFEPSPRQRKISVMSNLRCISAAADQYFIEHGVNKVKLSELVASNYILPPRPADGESYEKLELVQGGAIVVETGDRTVLSYPL